MSLVVLILALQSPVRLVMRRNLGFVWLVRAWVGMDWKHYAVAGQSISPAPEVEHANRFLGMDPILLDDPMGLLMTLHRTRGQDTLAGLFAAFVDVRDHHDVEAVSLLTTYKAYGILLDVGRLLREQGEFTRAIVFLEAAAKVKPNEYSVLRELIFLYRSEKYYCDMLRVAQSGISRYGYEFYVYHAQAYEGLQLWQLAIEDYRKAAELADTVKNRTDIETNITVLQRRVGTMPSPNTASPFCEP